MNQTPYPTPYLRKQIQFRFSAFLAIIATFVLAQSASATSYTWTNAGANWSTTTSWNPNSPAGGPTAVDTASLTYLATSGSATTPNNIVDLGFAGTIAAFSLSPTNSGTFQVTQIPTGQTLFVSGRVTAGQQNGSNLISQVYFTGSGRFITG